MRFIERGVGFSTTQGGYSYQFQSTTNLTTPVWISEGAAFACTGELVKKTISNVSPEKFFRVGVTVQ